MVVHYCALNSDGRLCLVVFGSRKSARLVQLVHLNTQVGIEVCPLNTVSFRCTCMIRRTMIGLVRITSWYPYINGSHFGLPPSEIHRMTGLPPKIV